MTQMQVANRSKNDKHYTAMKLQLEYLEIILNILKPIVNLPVLA